MIVESALPKSYSRMAWLGFSGGVILTYLYTALFLVYAVLRLVFSAFSIIEPPYAAETLVLFVISLLLPVLIIAALMGLVAGLVGAVTALVAHWLKRWIPVSLALVGTSLTIAVVVNVLILTQSGSGLLTDKLPTYLFWLGFPSVVYVTYSVWIGAGLARRTHGN